MNIDQSHPRNERIRLATQIQWVKKGYRWVKSLWQEHTTVDYCLGTAPLVIGELIGTCSQQVKWIVWQNYQRLTLFR